MAKRVKESERLQNQIWCRREQIPKRDLLKQTKITNDFLIFMSYRKETANISIFYYRHRNLVQYFFE